MDAQYVTIKEAARLLGVHPNTVRSRIKAGLLAADKALTPTGEAYAIPRHLVDPSQSGVSLPGDLQPLVSLHDAQNEAVGSLTIGSQGSLLALQQLVAPLVEANAHLTERVEELARENGRLQAEVERLQAAQQPQSAPASPPVPEPTPAPTPRPAPSWGQRLRRWWRG